MSSRLSTLPPGLRARLPDLALISVTLLWGGTFLATQAGLAASGPFGFLATRFAIAAFILLLVSRPTMRGLTGRELRAGIALGSLIAVAFSFQTAGLQHIESSKSAFLTALYVPLVPLFELLFFRRRLPASAWLGVALAFVGLVCLSGVQGMTLALDLGETLTLMGAVFTTLEILLISHFAQGTDPRRLAVVQLSVSSLVCLGGMALFSEPAPRPTPGFLACVVGLGVASAYIQVAMFWAQKTVSSTRATLIYALEPVWAGVFGRLAGERLGPIALLGGALIVVSIVASELRWPAFLRRHTLSRASTDEGS